MIAQYLPAPARRVIYAVLAALAALELVWDVVPSELEGKCVASAVALGFGLAFTQTSDNG